MIRSKCDECGGKLKLEDVDFSLFGTSLGRFPAEVCTKCGEKVFSEEVSDRIDSVAKERGLWGLGAAKKNEALKKTFGTLKFIQSTEEILRRSDKDAWDE
ncbi:hypothetical protein HYY74_00870 [Candidatus Woesearchaeota archaeon]|nr:hypothetical protein [Candidatus Woesearchaeota archaeon]